jgi:hypothetical protein
MAKLREEVDARFRCLEEDFCFDGKMEYVRHRVEVPGGYGCTEWKQGQAGANCPHAPFHRIELAEEPTPPPPG